MSIHNPLKNIYLVDLDQLLEGYRSFISCWIYRSDDVTILVDPGPRSSISVLMQALKDRGIKKIDYILLTHIHLDHAGGTGLLLAKYPDARVICHPRGIKHMINPLKLWEASKKVLGHVAEVYGEIVPISERNIGYQDYVETEDCTITVWQTPGHAPHHLSYQMGDILFAGEVAGISYPFNEDLYLRIATPPVFNYETYKTSLEKVAGLDVCHLCFGHYGYRGDAKRVFVTAIYQLDLWMEIVERHLRYGSEPFEEKVFSDLLEKDIGLSRYFDLPADIRVREKRFSLNSIRGIRKYLTERYSIM